MKFLSASFAGILHRTAIISGYTSSLAGIVYFGFSQLALQTSKTENLSMSLPKSLLGTPMLIGGLLCVALGALSLLAWLLSRNCAREPVPTTLRQHGLILLAWIPMLIVVWTMINSAFAR